MRASCRAIALALAVSLTALPLACDDEKPSRRTARQTDPPVDPTPPAAITEQETTLAMALFEASANDPAAQAQAAGMLEEAVLRNPEDDTLKLNLADAYVLMDREVTLAFAIDLYEDVFARHGDDVRIPPRLADAYLRLGNAQDAFRWAETYAGMLGEAPYPAAALVANIALTAGKIPRGTALLDALARQAASPHAIRLLQASLLAEAGQVEKAVALIQPVIDALPAEDPIGNQARQIARRIQP